jgi:hypothetical protein
MFSWICPRCGSTVPPHYSECPNCAAPADESAPAEAQTEAAVDVEPTRSAAVEERAPVQAPPAAPLARPAPVAPSAVQPPHTAPPSGGKPSWLNGALAALGVLVVVGLTYFVYRNYVARPQVAFETPPVAQETKPAHPLARVMQITAIRLSEDARQRPQARFVVVNYSGAPLTNVNAVVTLRRTTDEPGRAPLAEFNLQVPKLDAYGSREMQVTLDSNLRAYEFPDWQFIQADLRPPTAPQ